VLIIGGVWKVEPEEREAFLAGRHEMMRSARQEPGCLEHVFSADPIDPTRVVLYEQWASQEALDAHLAAMTPTDTEGMTPPASIIIYDVAGERHFGE